ncbi:AAA family ATPase [uncultured Thiodictyon sp.]|jgi:hypothetical protein|uniref:AAA family ATPase n=1 Tax=uncultured Thiodictyon sp. TaxID=1846217 RepID=UPI0025EE7654|nr:AAA family ATPase [uncultured Thiodictyon sp.]
MKIGIMGAQNTGKSTFVQDFLQNWPMYKKNEKHYSSLVKEKGIKLNEEGNEESQEAIMNFIIDQVMPGSKKDKIIYDRTVLDNLMYTMWMNSKGMVSDEFVKKCIPIIKESLTFYDILFFLPITKFSPIPIEEKEHRSSSLEFREESDHIMKALVNQYNLQNKTYFPFDNELGCPAIVEIFGNREERIELAKMYITPDGIAFRCLL